MLGEVLRAQESTALFETEETVRALAKSRRAGETAAAKQLAEVVAALPVATARATASAFAVYFDLVNLAEEGHRIQALRARELALHPAPIGESIGEAVGLLKTSGFTSEQMAALLGTLRVELVLTAHPTEAKRRTILSKLQRLSEALRRLHDPDLLPRERAAEVATLRAEITSLWLTNRARTTRPAVTDEVRTGLYFVDAVFWDTVPAVAADLERALHEHYPELTPPSRWLQSRRPLPEHVAYLEQRYASEPYRLALSLLAADLEAASQEDMTSRLLDEAPHTARITAAEVRTVVDLVAQGVPPALAGDRVRALEHQIESFGLHAARLDIREDSGRLAAALGDILARLGLEAGFAERDEPARAAVLLRLLAEEAPKASEISALALDELSVETWRLFRLLGRAQAIYGRGSLGPFIISMTRGPADLLTALLLARWAGGASGMPIVPLFE